MSSSTPTLKVERRKPRFRFVVFTSSCSDSLSSTRRRLIRGIRLIDEDRTFIDPDMLDKLCDDYEDIVLRIEALERDIKDSFAKSGPKKPNCFHVWRLNLSHLSQTRTLEIKAAQWERIVINTSATAAVKRIRDTSRDMRTSPRNNLGVQTGDSGITANHFIGLDDPPDWPVPIPEGEVSRAYLVATD